MLRIVLLISQIFVLALAVYNLATALPGLRSPRPVRPGPRRRRLRVVVPAHNEAAVVPGVLSDLAAQRYPSELVRVVVLADRCTDETAAVARPFAEVVERHRGRDGKGALIGWYLDAHPLDADEALVILDADNRVGADFLAAGADVLDTGYDAAQAYLDVSNPDSSWLATTSALSYWASNRMVQLARYNVRWPPDLGGTGTFFTELAVSSLGGFPESGTEDQEQGARLALAGMRIAWMHESHVRDQKPVSMRVAVNQRARWSAGRRAVSARYRWRLLGLAVRRRRWGPVDLAIRQAQPGRTFMVVVATGLAIGSLLTDLIWSWPVWVAVVAVQVLAPLVFLARDGTPGRYLWRYPLLVVFGLLWLPVQLLSLRTRGWYHTPHA